MGAVVTSPLIVFNAQLASSTMRANAACRSSDGRLIDVIDSTVNGARAR
jgi:hypothetical protein